MLSFIFNKNPWQGASNWKKL